MIAMSVDGKTLAGTHDLRYTDTSARIPGQKISYLISDATVAWLPKMSLEKRFLLHFAVNFLVIRIRVRQSG